MTNDRQPDIEIRRTTPEELKDRKTIFAYDSPGHFQVKIEELAEPAPRKAKRNVSTMGVRGLAFINQRHSSGTYETGMIIVAYFHN